MPRSCRSFVDPGSQFLNRASMSSPMVMVHFGNLPYRNPTSETGFHNERFSSSFASDSQLLPATKALESISRPRVSTMLQRRLLKALSLSPGNSPSKRRIDIDTVMRESRRARSESDFPSIEWDDDMDVETTRVSATLKRRQSKSRLVRSLKFRSKLCMLQDDEISCSSSISSSSSMETDS